MVVCDAFSNHGEPLLPGWMWTSYLSFCIYNNWDVADFLVGMGSVLLWTVALLPQIWQNYATKKVESQSVLFWILWITGDTCNLIACFLSGQVVWNTSLAIIYATSCYIVLIQWWYYSYCFSGGTYRALHNPESYTGGLWKTCLVLLCCGLFLASGGTTTGGWLDAGAAASAGEVAPTPRRLMHSAGAPRKGLSDEAIVGEVMGWGMAVLYVSSRIPQLYKTITSKEAEDLSAQMFFFTCLGNLTQFASLVLKPKREWSWEYAVNTAPWTINALLCGLQDVCLMLLIWKYQNPSEDSEGYFRADRKDTREIAPLMIQSTPIKDYSATAALRRDNASNPSGGPNREVTESDRLP